MSTCSRSNDWLWCEDNRSQSPDPGVSPHTEGSAASLQVEMAFGAAEVLQHWPEVSPGLSPCSGQGGLALLCCTVMLGNLISLRFTQSQMIPREILEGPECRIMSDIWEWLGSHTEKCQQSCLVGSVCLKFLYPPWCKEQALADVSTIKRP